MGLLWVVRRMNIAVELGSGVGVSCVRFTCVYNSLGFHRGPVLLHVNCKAAVSEVRVKRHNGNGIIVNTTGAW